jgi:hypothetical protein
MPATGEAGPGLLEEGDDPFLALAAAMEADDDPATALAPTNDRRTNTDAGGQGLSWAAAAAAGTAGAVLPGRQPRHAILLPPGEMPCAPAAANSLVPASLGGGRAGSAGKVVLFGAAAGSGTPAANAGTFSDVGQGSLIERYAGLKVGIRRQ